MKPELLALLSTEQQEAWRIHEIASYMPSAYVADALLELAQAKQALAVHQEIAAIYQQGQQNACDKLDELRAAVADAPHDMWCAVTFPAAPADLMSCNCWKSETK